MKQTITDTGHEGIGSSRGIVREYNPAVGCWTPVQQNRDDFCDDEPRCQCPCCHCSVRTEHGICDMCFTGAHQG